MKTQEIMERTVKLKKSGKKVCSNCFVQFRQFLEEEWDAVASEESLYIVNRDHGVNRIWFYTTDFDDLSIAMQKSLALNEEYVIDILSKDALCYQKELEKMGFYPLAKMMRMSNPDISGILQQNSVQMEYYNAKIGNKARLEDAAEINQILWKIFDSRISHLQTLEELKASIQRGEISIYRDGEDIAAILQRIAEPKSFYINQIYNRAKKQVIHAIVLNELKEYNEKGGKYVYAWVEEGNQASLRFHGKYGLKHDGLWNIVYKKERLCGQKI